MVTTIAPRTVGWRARSLIAPASMAAAACAAAAVVVVVDPNEPGHYPTCPVLALTGFYCTGCGVLRAARALLQLDVATAWQMNPLLLVLAPVIIGSWVAWVIRAWTGRPRRWLAPPWAVTTMLAVVVLFTVGRNVPAFAPWLAPG